ncbi:hypothetical protein BN946_scf184760.g4 [Trametes cinnabarina]|uniref:Methyltransferase type 11 domain-containing protein n=1 Tax=Pycnoporus cinnabarinus TaxID=5643 RepID=A0A060S7S8_PYCCI|nr:hypothetical protein BN946_scf184760.g4 [Trametes cinnabarina]
MLPIACKRLASLSSVRRNTYASVSSSSSLNPNSVGPFQVFDRNVKRMQKDRAAARDGGVRSRTVDYVRNEVADNLAERFQDIKRKFHTVLDLGSGPVEVERIHADEENLLQVIQPNSQEAIVSCLSLHWVNDLPGVLVQIKEALKPDGVFLGALFGGDTLFELRTSLQLAEVEREGGISAHVSPMTDSRDMSNLLSRAGFTLLTVDVDEVKVAYPSMWELMEDLQDMGENNAVVGRRHFIHRDTLAAASAIYKELHGHEDGTVPATFQVIYVIGWKPAPNQPKPLERGSGQTNLKDVL